MKQPIRYFSIGLLTASIIILVVVSFFDKSNSGANESSVEEMIAALKTDGYHVLSSSDYISLTVAANSEDDESKEEVDDKEKDVEQNDTEDAKKDESTEDKPKEEETKDDEEKAEEPKVYHYTLTIEPNTLGPTVGKLLKENNIIDNAAEFSRYLETEGYAEYIQLGKHKVSSDMTHHQIAEVIARSR